MFNFRLVITDKMNGSMNMAIDEALIYSVIKGDPVIRFYRWKPPCLTIGYSQKITDINVSYCKESNISIVRRITGGASVYHDQELTYSFICKEAFLPKSVVESYKKISTGLVYGLNSLGIAAQLHDKKPKKKKTPNCFISPSWYELKVNGKKLIGSAQKRMKGVVLQHGSLLINYNSKTMNKIFNENSDIKSKVISIKQILGQNVSFQKLSNAMIHGFQKALDLKLTQKELTKKELNLAENLSKHKYYRLEKCTIQS